MNLISIILIANRNKSCLFFIAVISFKTIRLVANFCVKIRSSIIRNSFSDTVNSLFFGFFITRFRRDLRSSRQIKALKSQTGPTHTQSLQPLHGLRTPNEGINQRNLKFWADVADKICYGRIYKFGIGI